MSRKMLINATHPEEHRVAIVENGMLSELDIEITGKQQTKGNIYKAVVVRVETGLQAAFVDYGGERPGFLQIGEVHPSLCKGGDGESQSRPRISDMLRRGQELLVQVVKEERGTKGAALTTYLSLPGRYMVLMPESDSKGISRKIEQDSVRKKLKEVMNSMDLPDNIGYIVRTAGIGQKKSELRRDVDYLLRVYEKIRELGEQVKAPALVYKESNLVIRSIRDYFSPDIDEVLVDDPKAAQEGKEFFQEVMPEYAQLVKLHQERRPIFSRYQLEEQIEVLSRSKVPLPSGGSIVIDPTEALVAIDVNSGKMASEKGVEATAFKSNMEAAAEVARQLRLRDLGGLIVIDFIDMRDRKHIRDVEKCLKEALKHDKARVSVGRISQFGLLEMSRQRIKSALAEASYLTCPHCEGGGRIRSAESQALNFVRRLCAGMAKGQIGRVEGQVPLEVAAYLLNNKRADLIRLEQQYDAAIIIHGVPEFTSGQLELEFIRREKEESKAAENYVDASTVRALSGIADGDTGEAAEQATQEAAVEETASTAGTPEAPSGRKRRRPRRRRKSSESRSDDPATPVDAEAVSATQDPAKDKQAAATATTAAEDKILSAQPVGDTPSAPFQDTTAQEPGNVPQATRDKAAVRPPAENTGEAVSERRKPTRRKPAASKKPAVKTEASQQAQEIADPATEQQPVVTEKTKVPRGRRRPARKKATEKNDRGESADSAQTDSPQTAAASATGDSAAAEGPPAETSRNAESPAKPVRRRRTVKKNAATEPAEAAAGPEQKPPSEAAPEKAPDAQSQNGSDS